MNYAELLTEPGDCGKWIFSVDGDELYGHIVAGCPGSKLAYYAPASAIRSDIELVTGESITLQNVSTLAPRSTATGARICNPTTADIDRHCREWLGVLWGLGPQGHDSQVHGGFALGRWMQEPVSAGPWFLGRDSHAAKHTSMSVEELV